MTGSDATYAELLAEIEELRLRLEEAEETLRAVGSGAVDGFIVTGSDGDQLFTLKSAEQPYRVLVEAMSEGAATLTPDGVILYGNTRLAEMLNIPLEKLIGSRLESYVVPADRPRFTSLCAQAFSGNAAEEFTLAAGDASAGLPVLISFSTYSGLGSRAVAAVITDVSERNRAEEERQKLNERMYHVQKLESLGVLAGGIAHDFNNLLTAIVGNVDMALLRTGEDSPVVENLHRIQQASSRAADLAGQMLAYSGKGKFVVENLDLNIVLAEMLNMLEVSIGKNVELRRNFTLDLPLVNADVTQIRQVIMNLVINASEAIGEQDGFITISTGTMECGSEYLSDVWLQEHVQPGQYVSLKIADSGCGMNLETASKIFDPFFTTKFTGRGLGMAAVLGIIRGHKGCIKISSEPGHGTTFTILLPVSVVPDHHDVPAEPVHNWRGSGHVLLVDDEESVRGIGSEILKMLGFTPVVAADGREALEAVAQNPDISLVILDLTMPHMGGEECFRELRRLRPDIRIIITSGFSEYEVEKRFTGMGMDGFVQKPYKLATMRERIQQVIHS